jgi:bifunctional NMN adenylyltransferase/nudix hydrolase
MSTNNQKALWAVAMGRFQIPHRVHFDILERAGQVGEHVLVLIGSTNHPRTIKDPFTYTERMDMLVNGLKARGIDVSRYTFRGMEDRRYSDHTWTANVRDIISNATYGGRNMVLVGHKKDKSSYYIDMFPELRFDEFQHVPDIGSTSIRDMFFTSGDIPEEVPEVVHDFLNTFKTTDEYDLLCKEYEYVVNYRAAWASAPFIPTFTTVDGLVLVSGHILLIKRRLFPGKGLWALPGGFLEAENEWLKESMVRELREETRLKVPEPVIRGSIKRREVFDDPNRSLRGRTITHAFLIELPHGPLPEVRHGSDAGKAFWLPLNEVFRNRDKFFEDHCDIILRMTGGV